MPKSIGKSGFLVKKSVSHEALDFYYHADKVYNIFN